MRLWALDVALFQWRRMAERGEFKGKLVESLSEKLDPAILQGLLSVSQISSGLGREAPQAPTIGMVAEVMAVDPSRASRIVSELVSRGFVERRASQEDARKSTLVVSPKGQAFSGRVYARQMDHHGAGVCRLGGGGHRQFFGSVRALRVGIVRGCRAVGLRAALKRGLGHVWGACSEAEIGDESPI